MNGFGLYRRGNGSLVRIESLIPSRSSLMAFLENARPDDTQTVAIVLIGEA
ncbi:hypothetical protein [Frondihabitans sucicola]|uniref:hypothetical protein n=1 Tax=Frondihabitans sucicola TaxID=1268041 RepID=UPI002574414B|nr:hypothetical protein [Frondihabitans sucicola]